MGITNETNSLLNKFDSHSNKSNSYEEKLEQLCECLKENSIDCEKVVKSMEGYISNNEKIYYYVITSWFYGLKEKDNDICDKIVYNCDRIYKYIEEKHTEDHELKDFFHRFYDHINLASIQYREFYIGKKQLEKANENLEKVHNDLEKANENLEKFEQRLKNAEAHSTTILGIFSAIAFSVGGMFSFSGHVLESIDKVDKITLFIAALIILAAFLGAIGLLTYFIKKIHDHK